MSSTFTINEIDSLQTIIVKKIFENRSLHSNLNIINELKKNKLTKIYSILESYLLKYYGNLVNEYNETDIFYNTQIDKLSCKLAEKSNHSDYNYICILFTDELLLYKPSFIKIKGKSILDKFNTLSKCKCCERHKNNNPDKLGLYIQNKKFYEFMAYVSQAKKNELKDKIFIFDFNGIINESEDKINEYKSCFCRCRQIKRIICYIFNYNYFQIYKNIPNLKILEEIY